MIKKNIDEITIKDIEDLIQNKIIERKTLEYKEQLPSKKTEDKKEFLYDVSSFANASGGDLIYGVKEDRETGEPLSLKGIELKNIDQIKLRLDQMIRDGIEPNIPSSNIIIREIQISENSNIIIIRIFRSWLGPHRISFNKIHRFYSRDSNGRYLLDINELRSAFLLSETLTERIRRFRENRMSKVYANETPIPILSNPKVLIHIIPLSSFSPGQNIDVGKIKISRLELNGLL